ncbi:MAG: toll/interleukin-1 receptor domain-containing protein, partial [Pseudomonadota bacterium]
MKDFFISYNKADRQWAEWIAWQIMAQGRQVVIQAWDFGPGCNFPLAMQQGIQECEKILLVLSPDYLKSEFTQPEWAAYFAQDPKGDKRQIVPVRVRDCQPGGLLAPIVYVDLLGIAAEAEARRQLLQGLFGGGPPATPPVFPVGQVAAPPFPVPAATGAAPPAPPPPPP